MFGWFKSSVPKTQVINLPGDPENWTWEAVVETVDDALSSPKLLKIKGPMFTKDQAKYLRMMLGDEKMALVDAEDRIWPMGRLRSHVKIYEVKT